MDLGLKLKSYLGSRDDNMNFARQIDLQV